MEITQDNILKAKVYMYEYRARVETHKTNLGIIGRFFEKLNGTTFYNELEIQLFNEYGLRWIDAYEILFNSNNKDKIYNL